MVQPIHGMADTMPHTQEPMTMNNYPNATDAEWNEAYRIIRGSALANGIGNADAEDMAQEATRTIMTRRFRIAPENPVHAARVLVRGAKRFGFWSIMPNPSKPQRQRELDSLRPVREAGYDPSPAQIAETAERHGIPLEVAMARAGYGPQELAEPTSAVSGSGIGYTPPQEGCPGLHLATDPNPSSRTAAALAAANDARRVAGLPPLDPDAALVRLA